MLDMNAIRVVVGMVVAALGFQWGVAQSVVPPLTMEAAVELAIQRNPEMLISLEEIAQLKGKITEVRSSAFPQVTFQGYGLRMRDPSILNSSSFDKVPQEFRDALVPSASNLFDMGINVKQPIYTAGKIRNALRLAEESLKEKRDVSESVRQMLTFKVFQSFNDLLLAEANRDLVREMKQQRVQQLELAESRYNSGVATEIDVLRSKVNVANLEPALIRADNGIRLTRAAINSLIVVDLEAPTQIVGSLEYRPWSAGTLEEIQRRTLDQRPELQASRKQVEQARLYLALARAENKLTVDMEGQYGYSVRELNNMFVPDYSRWNLTVNFKLPLYDSGRKSGLVAQALAQLRAAEQRLAQLENDYRLDVKQAYDDMQSFAEAIAAAKLSVGQAEKVHTMMQANYRYGAATTLEVMDAQTALAVARNSQISATYDYEMAKARLRLASGSPILDKEATQ
jgi:outer membrane protein